MKIKERLFQPILFGALLIIVLVAIDLNIPHVAIKLSVSVIIFVGLIISWYEKEQMFKNLAHKYENTSVIMENFYKYCPEFIICKDNNLNYTLCNEAVKKQFKLSKLREIKGKNVFDFLNNECATILQEKDREVLKNKKNLSYVLQLPDLDNNYYHFLSIPIKKGNNIKGLVTIARNVTKEEELKNKLNESYSQIGSVINNFPIAAYIIDVNGKYILGNEKSYKFYTEGIDPENSNLVIDIAPVVQERLDENKYVIQNKKILVKDRYLKAKDGTYHWYGMRKAPWIDNNGDARGVIVFIRNIDTTKNVQKQRENYIATLSHDLKTPTLAQIRTLELLLKGAIGPLTKDQTELLQLMLDSSNYMYSMVDTLVSTYKYENGEVVLSYENFSVLELIEECIMELDHDIKTSQIKINIESKTENPIINADRTQLKRVIENLITNGVGYGFKNTILTISINDIIQNNIPQISVKFINKSPYMTEETINNIFKRYVSHADKFNKVGAGLGLYLFKQIIDAHNGNIIVNSSKDDINTFGFVINK